MEKAMREVERTRALRFQDELIRDRSQRKPKKLSLYFVARPDKPAARRFLKSAA